MNSKNDRQEKIRETISHRSTLKMMFLRTGLDLKNSSKTKDRGLDLGLDALAS